MKRMNRREFMRLGTVTLGAAVVAGCTSPTPAQPTTAPQPTKAPAAAQPTSAPAAAQPTSAPAATQPVAAAKFKEAPMLAELVKAGKLPPVEQRLPVNPWVAATREVKGKYGGIIRMVYDKGNEWHIKEFVNHQMVWYDAKMNLKPYICESYEVSSDGKTYTFHLRKGTKWSDGTPATAQDYVWWHKNVASNKEISPNPPGVYSSRGSDGKSVLATCEAPDDWTVKYTYAHTVALKLYDFSKTYGAHEARPSHYMKQFHIDTCADKDKLMADAKAAGFEKWVDYFNSKNAQTGNPDRPELHGWKLMNKMRDPLFVGQRNPYFFGVDQDGNQLPYTDQLTWRAYDNMETAKLWILNGEIDMWPVALSDLPAIKDAEAKSKIHTILCKDGSSQALQLNMTTKNEKLAKFFQTREVRYAISYGVNRQEIADVLFAGHAIPRQYSPLSMSPLYNQAVSTNRTKYDAKQANDLLDKAGYKEKNAEGLRVWPGTTDPITWTVEVQQSSTDVQQMAAGHLKKIGLNMIVKTVTKDIEHQHAVNNELEANGHIADRALIPLLDPTLFFLEEYATFPIATSWMLWRVQPTNPVAKEPPADHWIRDIWKLADQIRAEPVEDKRNQLFGKVLEIWDREQIMNVYTGEADVPVVLKNGLRNYPGGVPLEWSVSWHCLTDPEQWTWEDPGTQSAPSVKI